MNAPAFTKGPWALSRMAAQGIYFNDGGSAIIGDDERVATVDCQSPFKRGEGYKAECAIRDANARLIAAAPDLYEALEGLLTFAEAAETKMLVGDEGCLWPVEAARAALAKARGEA